MKYTLTIFFLAFALVSGFSQITHDKKICRRALPVKNEELLKTGLMSDIMSDFPKTYYNSTLDYVSVGISVCNQGIEQISDSYSDLLTEEQKKLLSSADPGSDICIFIKFKYKDTANNNLGTGGPIKEMNFVTTVLPHSEAEFNGGTEQAITYLKDYVIKKMGVDVTDKVILADISFWVDEAGLPSDVKIMRSSTDEKIDQLLIEAAKQMPQWKPASNSKGTNIKQMMVITLGTRRC